MTVYNPSLDFTNARPDPILVERGELRMLAHDIRGALQGVAGGVAALELSDLPADILEQIDRIAAASRSLQSLIDLAVGNEAEEAGEGHVSVAAFIEGFGRRWTGEARAQGMDLDVRRDRNLPGGVKVGNLPLARMVGNLAANAIAHAGQGTIEARFSGDGAGGMIVSIRDGGPGMPQAVIDRVLGPEGSRAVDATSSHGLGLSIVRGLADAAGCRLVLRNPDGGGAQAEIEIPASLCVSARPTADREPAPAKADLSGVRILLAEDNPTNQMVATQMLRALGADFVVCSDGVEALEKFEAEAFDLVVVDIEMPRLSGLDVIRRIRARPDARSETPMIALTAYALREHRDRIADAGADGLISKPITSVEALGRGLARHLHRASPGAGAPEAPAARTEPEAEQPVVDRATYQGLAAAIGEEMVAELLDKVVADLVDARATLAGAVDPLDRAAVRGSSHILISVAGAIGAKRLQACARELNVAAHDREDASLPPGVERCIAEIDAALAFARDERAAI